MPTRKSVLQNSIWYGVETALDIAVSAGASIAVARVMGPERLGRFLYLVFLTNVAGRVGGAGIATAVRKYMAEYLARGESGRARIVFEAGLRLQTAVAALVVAAGCAAARLFGDPDYRPVAYILVIACAPGLLTLIPAQAHVASEDLRRNVPSAIAGQLAYAAGVALSLALGWGLAGLAAAQLARRSTEAGIRISTALAWVRRLPRVPCPKALWRPLLRFSGQSLAVTIITIVVWDRSEVLFLKQFCNLEQLAFYSLAFTVIERSLLVPTVLGTAFGAKIMAAYTREPGELGAMISDAARRTAVIAVPLECGLAALSGPLMQIAYGKLYAGAVPALAISALLAIPKAFQWLPVTVLQAADRQQRMLKWLLVAAAANLGLDAALIRFYGAAGAAAANGLAQAFATGGLWLLAAKFCGGARPLVAVSRAAVSAAVMGVPVILIALALPPIAAVAAGVPTGIFVYVAMLRLTRALNASDAAALSVVSRRLPAPARFAARKAARLLFPPAAHGAPGCRPAAAERAA